MIDWPQRQEPRSKLAGTSDLKPKSVLRRCFWWTFVAIIVVRSGYRNRLDEYLIGRSPFGAATFKLNQRLSQLTGEVIVHSALVNSATQKARAIESATSLPGQVRSFDRATSSCRPRGQIKCFLCSDDRKRSGSNLDGSAKDAASE